MAETLPHGRGSVTHVESIRLQTEPRPSGSAFSRANSEIPETCKHPDGTGSCEQACQDVIMVKRPAGEPSPNTRKQMHRVVAYLAGPSAIAFVVLSRRFHLDLDNHGETRMIALLVGLVAFPVAVFLDFRRRGKRVLPRVPFWLLRGAAFGVWLYVVL